MIIDDEPGIRSLLSLELKQKSHRVEALNDASSALKHLEKGSIDLILCDVNMPGMSGFEFLEELRRRGKSYPVILMTGYATEEMITTAKTNGALEVISKPFELTELTALVDKLSRQNF